MTKILIAEDEALERSFLEAILKDAFPDSEVRSAGDGANAVELAEIWRPEVLLLDIRMPVLSGLEAAEKIRAILPQSKIAFITAYSEFSYAQQAIKLNVSDYILKPVEDDALINTVSKMVRFVEKEKEFASYFAVQRLTGGDSGHRKEQQQIMERVDNYMCNNYNLDLSLEAMADIIGISANHFSKLFKKYFGQNFIDRLTSIRIEQAKKLLLTTNKGTREIGEAVGYPSVTYFNTKFKKETGMPPAEYRRQDLRTQEDHSDT